MYTILKVQLPLRGLDDLVREASAEGYAFLEPLEQDWARGENRFDGEGEAFYGVFDGDELAAVGGLSRDPFLKAHDVGRLRRIYVRAAWRQQGIGRKLVATMLADAHRTFRAVRLRAENARAGRLYETFGFTGIDDPNATHILDFEQHAGQSRS